MKKILIVSQPRSGSTWVYDSLCQYINPTQTQSHSDNQRTIWDEPFSDSVQDWKQNFNAIVNSDAWVIKTLVQHHKLHNQQQVLQLMREADCVVKLLRHPKSITISKIAAEASNLYGDYTYHDNLVVNEKQIIDGVAKTDKYYNRLVAQPADCAIYYEDLKSPRHIYSLITNTDKVELHHKNNSDTHSKQNHIYLDDAHWVNRYMDKISNNWDLYPRTFDITRYSKPQ